MKLSELQRLMQASSDIQNLQPNQRLQDHIRSLGVNPGSLYQELEMTSQFVDTHRDISYTNAHMQLHSHTFYELLYCCNSCGAEYLIGSERYRLQEGDIIFIPPGVSHRPLLPDVLPEPYKRYVLWLSPEFVSYCAKAFCVSLSKNQNYASLLRPSNTQRDQLADLFYKGVQEAESKRDGWEAAVIGNTLLLLVQIKRTASARSTQPMQAEKPELLDRLTAYIENHYSEKITISELSHHFFVSNSTISHLFRNKLGVSFYRYVTQRRLIAAKNLIEQGAALENVAIQTGFLDYSGFYRAFKQEYGISPRQYKSTYHF